MSKKNKSTVPSIPTIYHNVQRLPERNHQCLVEDVNHQFFRFTRPESNHIVKEAIHKVWPSFNQFAEEPRQTILAYHAELFKSEPPKDQDDVTTAVYTWFKLCEIAQDRTEKTPVTSTGRSSSLLTRKYFRGEAWKEDFTASEIKTPQALTCYRIFRDLIRATEEKNLTGMPPEIAATHIPHVTEEELRAKIIERAGELHTRQDPWRIFQYYRPKLIKAHIIRHD